ncbi:MAG: PKD domain-containing protein [Candidatus Nanohalobium sp.]
MKAQSSVEYLVTYGWMLVAVTVVGGVTYQYIDSGCSLQVDSTEGPFPRIVDVGKFNNQTLAFELYNPDRDTQRIDHINFTENGETLAKVDVNREVLGRGRMQIRSNRFSQSKNCNTYKLQINYGGNLNLVSQAELKGQIKLYEILASLTAKPFAPKTGENITFNASNTESTYDIKEYKWKFGDGETGYGKTVNHSYTHEQTYQVKLTVTDERGRTDTETLNIYVGGVFTRKGGTLPKIGISNTLASTCIGNNCTNTTSQDQTAVSRRGDYIEGTLLTDKILKLNTDMCITSNNSFNQDQGCPKTRKGEDKPLTTQNYKMNGSLKAPVIKPNQTQLCIGNNC